MPFHDAPPLIAGRPIIGRRVALVIGNGRYEHASALVNPVNDAEAVGIVLARLGFDVVKGLNVDLRAIGDVQGEFEEKLRTNPDVALFFYAGHGLQVEGKNYLIPVDAEITQKAHLASRAMLFNDVLEPMAGHAGASIIFLDACRDNPFTRNLLRTLDLGAPRKPSDSPPTTGPIRGGLARIEKIAGTFIAYATAPDTVAYDGNGVNSPFTSALLKHIETPGTSIGDMMIDVRNSVLEETRGRQEPWDQSSLRSRFYFVHKAPAASTISTKMTEAPPDLREVSQALTDHADSAFATGRPQPDGLLDVAPVPGAPVGGPPGCVDEEALALPPRFLRARETLSTPIQSSKFASVTRKTQALTLLGIIAISVLAGWIALWRTQPVSTGISVQPRVAKTPEAPLSKKDGSKGELVQVGNLTRFVIELDRMVEFEVATINPTRMLLKVQDGILRLPPAVGATPVGSVKNFSSLAYAPGMIGVTIELTRPVIVAKAAVENAPAGAGARLVLDLVAAEQTAAVGSTHSKGQKPLLRPPPSKTGTSAAYKPVIVIDPAHSRSETGTRQSDLTEKDVALAFGLKLRELLDASGRYRVLMTRDSDKLVENSVRRRLAEESNASIFLTVNAHGVGTHSTGVTVTSLYDASREGWLAATRTVLAGTKVDVTESVREHENTGVVKDVLADLALREIAMVPARTRILVTILAGHTGAHIAADDSQHTFGVLKTAKLPSVIIQLGNVANKTDADSLGSSDWREKMSNSVVSAFDDYFSQLPM